MSEVSKGLDALEIRIQREFGYLNYPADNWVKPARASDGGDILDVAIIGGGMCGMAVAFGLMREGVRNFRIFDRQDKNFEGPWLTTARMKTLRSPKHLTGPHMGLPNLTFQAWFRAQWPTKEWEDLVHIPREMWMDYLNWYRQVLNIPTENNTALSAIEAEGNFLRLHFEKEGKVFAHLTRRVVMATGRAAFGGIRLPEPFKDVPRSLYAHTEDTIDFNRLKDKRVIVIGGAASAVDAAAVALETGAREVHLLVRSPEIPRLNKFKSTVYPGFFRGFKAQDDETRWRFLQHGFANKIAAPRASMLRLKEFENFHIHLGSAVEAVNVRGDSVRITTAKAVHDGDFIILGTGYAINIEDQPEFAGFSDKVLLWQDRYTPPGEIVDMELGRFPYLGAGFELLEKQGQTAPFLNKIHLFNAATTMTHAAVSSDIPGVNIGAERLVNALAEKFFTDAKTEHLNDFYEYNDPELLGDEWREE